MTNLESLLTLNSIYELGSIRIKRLLEYFGSAEKVLCASGDKLRRVEGISGLLSQNIIKNKHKWEVKQELELAEKNGIEIITLQDKSYPQNLKTIYDPPIVLYVKGRILESDRSAVAIVGSRRASIYGLSCAEKFSLQLAELGITVVSGMARGIDSAGHRGALKAKGRTIAVLGSGLLNIYPPENKELFEQIYKSGGAVISEFPLLTKPLAGNFPRRNRIISGLSLGVIVVEASRNSGALITADLGLEQGREVFAVPGKVDAVNSLGVNALIKQGAKLVTSIEDILSELKPNLKALLKESQNYAETPKSSADLKLNSEESRVYSLIQDNARGVDELVAESRLAVSQVMSALMNLELRHFVKQLPGKLFVRNYV